MLFNLEIQMQHQQNLNKQFIQSYPQILLGYALVEKKYAEYFPIQPIKPLTVQKPLTLLFIGLRDIAENHPQIDEIKKISASFDISGDNYDPFETEPEQVQNRGANTNQLITLEIDMPFIQQFAPIMDIFAWENSRDEKHILGYCSLPLSEFFEEMYKDQNKGEIQFDDSFGKNQNDKQGKMTIQKTKTKSLFAEENEQESLVIPQEELSYYEQRLDSQQNTNERMLQVQPVDIGEIKNFQLIDIDALNEQTLRDRQQLGNRIQYKQLFAARNTYYDSNYDGKQKIEKEEENKENKEKTNKQLELQQLPPNQEKEKLIQNKNQEQQEIQIQDQVQNKDQIQNQQQKQEEQEKQGNQQIKQQLKDLSKEQNLKMFEEEIQEKKFTDLSQIKRKNVKLKSLTKDLKQKYGDNKKQIDEGLQKIDQKMQLKLDPLLALQQAKEVKKISLDVFQFTDIETGNIIFFQLKQEKVEKKGKPTEETTYNLYSWVMYAKQDQNEDQQIYDQQNAQKIFLVKHSKPTGRTNFDGKIRGTVEIKYRQYVKEKLIQCCETAGIEYQESNAQFSSKARNKAVFLEDSNQLAQIQLDFPNKSDLKVNIIFIKQQFKKFFLLKIVGHVRAQIGIGF
ncbi:hypothetical protein PPERSA_04488 [Pseudocohnilembus persalinus]|uniref:Uncharacterized protein n=1 Tax=Pseudocohnilembus persalinus TaxID=266149 RepID=A0A0V0QTD2_PSEPJ|nr:hypothetical protein PPERSA_04488 [Pseudocohnilembus persalinus]|eukprot:KRX05451.1 hypothetical protein PPERSA_04488 [Pseudocohnilembus persalinus]